VRGSNTRRGTHYDPSRVPIIVDLFCRKWAGHSSNTITAESTRLGGHDWLRAYTTGAQGKINRLEKEKSAGMGGRIPVESWGAILPDLNLMQCPVNVHPFGDSNSDELVKLDYHDQRSVVGYALVSCLWVDPLGWRPNAPDGTVNAPQPGKAPTFHRGWFCRDLAFIWDFISSAQCSGRQRR